MKLVLQWVLAAVAALAIGPVAGWAVSANVGLDGSADATMLIGASPLAGVLGHLGALLLAAALGAIAAKLTTGRYGLFTAGIVLTWAAARTGRVEEILAVSPTGTTLLTLAGEGLILAAFGAVLAWMVCRDGHEERLASREPALSGETMLAVAAALVAGSAGAWVAAQADTKGQTILAAGVAGVAGAVLARVLAHRSAGWAVVLGVCVAGVAGPLLAAQAGAETVLSGLFSGRITGSLAELGRIAPLDWVAGACLGAPIGMTWAGSLTEKKHTHEPAAQPVHGA